MSHLGSAATDVRRPVAEHVFCRKSSGKGLLRAVFEGRNAIVFEDRNGSAPPLWFRECTLRRFETPSEVQDWGMVWILTHRAASVKVLDQAGIIMLTTMEDGTKILISQEMDDGLSDSLQFNEPPSPAPPRVAPSGAPKLKYPISKGSEPKGFSWFVEVDQAIEILQQGKTIGVLPC